jgi:hypothetical protein
MLYRLEIENFASIRDRQIIDLRAGRGVDDAEGRLAPVWRGAKEQAPKVVALFGANASGKSNVLKALSFAAWFIQDSFSAPRGGAMPYVRFNHPDTHYAPTRFAVHLGGVEDISRRNDPDAAQCGYVYEFVLSGPNASVVEAEALYYRPNGAARRLRLFERTEDGTVTAGVAFGLSGYQPALRKVLRQDASVIATLAQLDHPYALAIWDLVRRIRTNIFIERLDSSERDVLRLYAEQPQLTEALNREIERIDLGIHTLEIHADLDGPYAVFHHHGLALPMPLLFQSHGTRQFLKLFPRLWSALSEGGLAIIDELDAAIHPLILPEIIRWFHDPGRNPWNAQLWMSCHNASLLSDFVKEEVLFCEKQKDGHTEIYGLRDINVQRRDNHYKKYLGGAYGAVPLVG